MFTNIIHYCLLLVFSNLDVFANGKVFKHFDSNILFKNVSDFENISDQNVPLNFSATVFQSIEASPALSELFNLQEFSLAEVSEAFQTVVHDIVTYIRIELADYLTNLAKNAVVEAFDPSKYLNVFVDSLEKYLLRRNFMFPDPVTSAKTFIRHLKRAATSVQGSNNVLLYMKAVIVAINNFFIEDILKPGYSFLSAFINDLTLSSLDSQYVAPVVPGFLLPETNRTIFVTGVLKNISAVNNLMNVFSPPISPKEMADAFTAVIYKIAKGSELENADVIASNAKSAILLNYSPYKYTVAALNAFGTYILQHKFFQEFDPELVFPFYNKFLNYNFKSLQNCQPMDCLEHFFNVTYRMISLGHASLEYPPSLLSDFITGMYDAKGINYTLPNIHEMFFSNTTE